MQVNIELIKSEITPLMIKSEIKQAKLIIDEIKMLPKATSAKFCGLHGYAINMKGKVYQSSDLFPRSSYYIKKGTKNYIVRIFTLPFGLKCYTLNKG